jgi:hypothetical protein
MTELQDLAQRIEAVLAVDDPLSMAEEMPSDFQRLDDLALRLYFPVSPPMGLLAREMAKVDRGFRIGARLAETGMSAAELRSRSRPPSLPLRDGLVVEELAFGSLEIKFRPSPRIKKNLKRGAILIVGATAYLNDDLSLLDHFSGANDKPAPMYLAPSPALRGQLDVGLVRGNDLVTLTLQAPDGFVYQLPQLKAAPITPLPQPPGLPPAGR